ncbi:MAG: zinc dependent phospholipase C family protein [Chitinophagaceae bacterium]|nr:zinc dependent phospholipase C family protein [Chitinophagaceae bacterium]MCW5913609.1 zinc dependent phospholipase C family protein [Chitinophagaceae bacterium]MCZ2395643.1 zinc dependent phospholipase C family protein [Chitinophagales bacterium]
MKRNWIFLSILSVALILSGIALGWGSWGHKHINRAAVFSLPDEMRPFYYNHIDYITESSVVPDLRRPLLNDKQEGPRHYIDIEEFNGLAIADFPKTTKEAYEKFGDSLINRAGSLPWYIQSMMYKLIRAFKAGNKSEILFLSGEIAHYIGDAHVPLHTTSNHNGQLTGQTGIHSLWESTLPPMFGGTFNFKTDKPNYISDIADYTWKIIAHTYSLVDTVLAADKKLRSSFDTTVMYKRDSSGNRIMFYNNPVYSDAYASAFQKELGNMVEKQLRMAIYNTACYWYTAWVIAGRPDLSKLDDPELTKRNRDNFKKEYKAWQEGKILYLTEDKE